MNGLAEVFSNGRKVPDILVTCYSTILLSKETTRGLDAEMPNWRKVRDRRTKGYRRLHELELDITAIAEVEWMHGGELTEF